MTDRPLGPLHQDPDSADGPTRDVRLPPLPASPRASAPAQSARVGEPQSADATVVLQPPVDPEPPVGLFRQDTRPFGAPGGGALQAPGFAPLDQPAAGPAPQPAPVGRPPADSGPSAGRRWTWVLLVVLPIVVIAATGVLLFLLLNGG